MGACRTGSSSASTSDWFAERDVHIHVPAGAVPKDGPSAGIAMATALSSLAMNVPVSEDVAMTGEITLTGLVLPIGGVKEKVLAAERAEISTVILPRQNEPDLEELPEGRAQLDELRARGQNRRSARGRIPAGRGTRVS